MNAAENEMSVLVVDRGVGMGSGSVEQDEDVVFFGSREEEPYEVQLTGSEIGFRLERLQRVLVLNREDEHRFPGIQFGVGKDALEDGAHAFELMGGAARFFFGGVADDKEIWSADLNPYICLSACTGNERGQQAEERCNSSQHNDSP